MNGCRALKIGANQILLGLVREDDSVSGTESWGCGLGLRLPVLLPEGGRHSVCSQKSQRAEGGRVIDASVHCPSRTLRLCVCVCVCVCVRVRLPWVTKQGNDDFVASGDFLQLQWDQRRGLGSWTW